jgi:cytochrome P450
MLDSAELTSVSETSAHTLSFAITLLALYPDVQRKLFEEVVEVWPEGLPTSGAVSVRGTNFIVAWRLVFKLFFDTEL